MLEHRTVFVIQAALLMLMSGVILFAYRRYRRKRGDNSAWWLAAAYLTSGLGLELLAVEHSPYPQTTTILGNTLLLAFCGLACRGLAEATGQRARLWMALLAADAATVAAFSYWTWISPSWPLRSLASGIVTALMYGALIWLLGQAKERVIQPALRAMMGLFALHIVVNAARLLVWRYTGTSLWFSGMNILTIGGVALSYLWAESLREQEQMEYLAMTDPLTGLYNRRALDVIGVHEIRRAALAGRPSSAIMLDVDRFKEINDTQGHAAGDSALRAIAGVVQSVCDRGVRVGGDEFFLLLPDHDEAAAAAIAAQIHLALAGLVLLSPWDKRFAVSASIGCVTLHGEATTIGDLMHASDIVLFREKQKRRGASLHGARAALREESDGEPRVAPPAQ
ncbi:GGDEF domain-containing protein [Terriglobus roseus]|nr:GGDEF domain-containing protein [Terriglobus roseus]